MKTITLCMLLLSIGSASAIQIGNLIGNWSGKIIAKEEGEIAHQDKFTIKGIRRADGGVTLIQTDKGGWVSKHQFYKDGKFRMTQGVVSSVGVWKILDGKIVISGKTSNPNSTQPFTTELTMLTKNRFRMTENVPYYQAVTKWVANRD